MPVNPNILPTPEPDEPDQNEAEQQLDIERDAEAVQQTAIDVGPAGDLAPGTEPPKRKRRTKRELTDAAVVPADDEVVLIEDIITGAKIERQWLVALEMVRDKKAKFADKAMNYAMAKYDEQKTSDGPASQEPMDAADTVDPSGQTPPSATDESGQMLAPDGAEHGDEVVVGSKTYFVGPGGVLVDGVVDAPAKLRWQRQLGTGANGPWETTQLGQGSVTFSGPGGQETLPGTAPAEEMAQAIGNASAPNGSNGSASQNGDGVAVVWREFMPDTFERIGSGEWKVGSGLMDKIGLPSRGGEWSSLTVGPITASRTFSEDGEYTKVNVGGREEIVPVAGLRLMRMCRTLVEIEGNYMRGELASFLQTQGVVLTPLVSS